MRPTACRSARHAAVRRAARSWRSHRTPLHGAPWRLPGRCLLRVCTAVYIPGAAGDVEPLLRERPVRALREDAPGPARPHRTRRTTGQAPKEVMTETFERWDAARDLKDREEVRRYLEACTEQDPGDGSLIRAALNDIARAHSVTELAHETGMTRVGIYEALAPDGNPTFSTLMRITRALGMQARITV